MRAKSGIVSKKRHKKILSLAKGYYGRSKNCYRLAKSRVEKGMGYSYRDRRTKRRTLSRLYIIRINAAVRARGLIYSTFKAKLNAANISINNKVLSDMIYNHEDAFNTICAKL